MMSSVEVGEIEGRGRGVIATRAIKAGEILLSDSPLILYPAGDCCLSLSSSHHSPPWACEALSRLPRDNPELISDAHFLVAAYSLPADDFARLLSLDGAATNDTATSAMLLHSILRPPSRYSLDITSTLLAKDRINAFGLMEPLREEDEGRRRVRAYAIYPTASFFNHDCLPNVCRFDSNTDMVVRAIHDIPQGRELCLSYFPVNWTYAQRQSRLLEDYGFPCHCDRCEVEKNWTDDEEDDDMEVDEAHDGGGDDDFPHAYFFMRYLCDRDNCGGTLAPLPPSPQGVVSDVMECNVCGRLRKDEDGSDEDGDGYMLHE